MPRYGPADADRRGEREQVAGARAAATRPSAVAAATEEVAWAEGKESLRRRLRQRRVVLDQRPLAADRDA